MSKNGPKMTAEDYAGQSNKLELEMRRIRGILDRHAFKKYWGVASDDSPLIQKALSDLDNVVARFKKLDKKFWGEPSG